MNETRLHGISIQITNKCDKNCAHCNEESTMGGESMSFDMLKKILKKAKMVTDSVAFTGGEPLLWRDGKYNFEDIIRECKRLKLYVSTMVGGVKNSNDYDFLNKLWFCSFTLSFNLYKPDYEEVFVNAVKKLSPQNIINAVFMRYDDSNKEKTISEYDRIVKENGFTLPTILNPQKSGILRVGRARNILPYADVFEVCGMNELEKDMMHVYVDGSIFPCCGVFGKDHWSLRDWNKELKAPKDLFIAVQEKKDWCKTCVLRNND